MKNNLQRFAEAFTNFTVELRNHELDPELLAVINKVITHYPSCTPVVELPPGAIVLTREMLREAWNRLQYKNKFVIADLEKELFGVEK